MGIPWIPPSSLALEMDLPRASAMMMKRKGDIGSPCPSPLELLKKPSREPLTKTENLGVDIHSKIRLI